MIKRPPSALTLPLRRIVHGPRPRHLLAATTSLLVPTLVPVLLIAAA